MKLSGGVPAKHISFRFKKDKIEYLEKLAWWDWELDKIKENLGFLTGRTDQIL